MDGQREVANLTIIDLLKAYVMEVYQCDQGERYLIRVECAFYNTKHTSTGETPFEIVEGRPKYPLMVTYLSTVFMANEYKILAKG